MSATTFPIVLTDSQMQAYERDGFHIARGLFSPQEAGTLQVHFDALQAVDRPGVYEPNRAATDPLQRFPRMMQPHRWDDLSLRTLLDPRVVAIVAQLLGEEPLAAQSMFYWKPPQARGQALHQDNFYLKVKPHSCIAAWTAVDHCDGENGGLMVVPKTHKLPILCPDKADLNASFVEHLVRPPDGSDAVQLILAPGDTLFFNGSVIHGSEPNRSATRFRRAFICHYLPVSAQECSQWFFPLLDWQGGVMERAAATGGGPCGDEHPVPDGAVA